MCTLTNTFNILSLLTPKNVQVCKKKINKLIATMNHLFELVDKHTHILKVVLAHMNSKGLNITFVQI